MYRGEFAKNSNQKKDLRRSFSAKKIYGLINVITPV